MSADGITELRRIVLAEPALQRALLSAPDRADFVRLAVDLAHHHGLEVDSDDIEREVAHSRRAWNDRWV